MGTWRSDERGITPWHYEWAPLADGQADLSGYIAALVRADYQGWVTVEDFTDRCAARAADGG
ncbi:MAG: hypothetical protein WDM88_05880 [Galbitalea sp.]